MRYCKHILSIVCLCMISDDLGHPPQTIPGEILHVLAILTHSFHKPQNWWAFTSFAHYDIWWSHVISDLQDNRHNFIDLKRLTYPPSMNVDTVCCSWDTASIDFSHSICWWNQMTAKSHQLQSHPRSSYVLPTCQLWSALYFPFKSLSSHKILLHTHTWTHI